MIILDYFQVFVDLGLFPRRIFPPAACRSLNPVNHRFCYGLGRLVCPLGYAVQKSRSKLLDSKIWKVVPAYALACASTYSIIKAGILTPVVVILLRNSIV